MRREISMIVYGFLFLCLLAANAFVYQKFFTRSATEVTVLAAGKGTAALVRASNGEALLINAGSDASILRALGTALPPWKRNLDAVIVTGMSGSAAGGLPDVLHRYRVATLLRPNTDGSKSLEAALAAAAGADMSVRRLAAHEIHISIASSTSIDILSPDTFDISYDRSILHISSTTPKGAYILDGNPIK